MAVLVMRPCLYAINLVLVGLRLLIVLASPGAVAGCARGEYSGSWKVGGVDVNVDDRGIHRANSLQFDVAWCDVASLSVTPSTLSTFTLELNLVNPESPGRHDAVWSRLRTPSGWSLPMRGNRWVLENYWNNRKCTKGSLQPRTR